MSLIINDPEESKCNDKRLRIAMVEILKNILAINRSTC
jgi:hypothetical protein